MSKQEIRARQLKARMLLTDDEYQLRNKALIQRTIHFLSSRQFIFVHLFLPIKKKREIDTWPLYDFLIDSEQHIPVLPKTHFKAGKLSHYAMAPSDKLEESGYGIPEPQKEEETIPSKLDLVFVPLLAFDNFGHRVGYGAGFYDRFLTQCPNGTLKVGLSILPPIDLPIEANSFDIPLDLCLTHEGIHDFSQSRQTGK